MLFSLPKLLLALLPLVSISAQTPSSIPPPPPTPTDLPTRLFKALKNSLIGGSPADFAARDYADQQEGVNRLTDGNYKDKVLNGKAEDIWVIALYGPTSELLNNMFVEAHHNASIMATKNQIENVKWARLDYMTEPVICSRYLVFRPPYIVIATEKGQKLRFYGPKEINPKGENLYKFIDIKGYEAHPVWGSSFGPGGDKEWLTDLYIKYLQEWTARTSKIPNFVWLILTGMLSKTIMGWMHTGQAPTTTTTTSAGAQAGADTAPAQKAAALRAALIKRQKEKEMKAE